MKSGFYLSPDGLHIVEYCEEQRKFWFTEAQKSWMWITADMIAEVLKAEGWERLK